MDPNTRKLYLELKKRGILIEESDHEPEPETLRIEVDGVMLREQLKAPAGLITEFMKQRFTHEQGAAERNTALAGLTAEELSVIAITAGRILGFKMNVREAMFAGLKLLPRLQVTNAPGRVVLVILENDGHFQCKIDIAEGEISVPLEIRDAITIIDASKLCGLMDEAMRRTPLSLPPWRASICEE